VTLIFAFRQCICIFCLKYRKYTMYFKPSILNNLTRKYLKYYFKYFLPVYFVKYFKYLSKSIFPITGRRVLTGNSSRRHGAVTGRPLLERTYFGPTPQTHLCPSRPHYGLYPGKFSGNDSLFQYGVLPGIY